MCSQLLLEFNPLPTEINMSLSHEFNGNQINILAKICDAKRLVHKVNGN